MFSHARSFAVIFFLLVLGSTSHAQSTQSPNQTGIEAVANEVGMLRQSVQSLDATLSDIANKFLPLLSKASPAESAASRISGHFALLTQAEQRAETMRKQLLELIEKETQYQTRITQIEEDMRPESIERQLNPYGTTRTAEMRETRRRVLDTERRGYQNLLTLVSGSRMRLEEDLKQADALVARLRARLNPLIDREIEKINPQP